MFKCLNCSWVHYIVAARAPNHQCIQLSPPTILCVLARRLVKWLKTFLVGSAQLLKEKWRDVMNLSYLICICSVCSKHRALVVVCRVWHIYLDYLGSPQFLAPLFLPSLSWRNNCEISTSSKVRDGTTAVPPPIFQHFSTVVSHSSRHCVKANEKILNVKL